MLPKTCGLFIGTPGRLFSSYSLGLRTIFVLLYGSEKDTIHQSLLSHKLVFYGGFSKVRLPLLIRNSTYVAQILCDLSYKV